MERLNFNHLFYFYIVAKEGSIKVTAEKLHVSQPTISDQIKLLEEYFECQLFLRQNRSLKLTKEGQIALEYAQEIFDSSNELTAKLRHKTRFPKKSTDIGITYFMSKYFLYSKILPLFEQNGLSVNIHQDEHHLLLAQLEEGNLDMVITDSKDSISRSMISYKLGDNKTFAVANKRLIPKGKTFPESLNQMPFFNYTNESALKFEIELFFARNNITPKVVGTANDTDLFELVTQQGLAFTIVPEVAKKRFCRYKDVVVLGEIKDLQTSVWAITKRDYKGVCYKILKNS